MVTARPASESSSGEGTINVYRSACSLGIDHKCLDTLLNFSLLTCATSAVLDFIFNPLNTFYLLLNLIFFSSLKYGCLRQHTPSDFLYPHFRCIYAHNDLTCSRAHTLESSEFSTIWLQLKSHSLTKLICAVYLYPNSSDYKKFFDYSTFKVEHILSPSKEILMFTTSLGFPLSSLTILVNYPSTLLSSMTYTAGQRGRHGTCDIL
ncbi:hypothetical protein E2C01_065321 [Portunus trituberculatus]|uniref:Uncharacterized protein n=1 Tax=Portunus trituberculatus TaxID=210409 RepID=A0A5B7HLK7_PORTR|nr:hypothetical protein [Portunus trituberculatus]